MFSKTLFLQNSFLYSSVFVLCSLALNNSDNFWNQVTKWTLKINQDLLARCRLIFNS